MFKHYFISLFTIFIIVSIFSCIVFYSNSTSNITEEVYFSNNSDFFWPTPGFYNITSFFGNRISPITKKAFFHYGIDISANEGSYIYSTQNGFVSFLGFNGANGYSIHITNNNFTFVYGHISPNYLLNLNDNVSYGQIIAQVGPKYVVASSENSYKDSTGKSTNGATTGPHLHFAIKKDSTAVNPLDYL